jgi:flagellum-specific ATP synthase
MDRQSISEPLDVGVRAINSLLTVGKGQRLGLFAGSGVGKSTLLGMMTRFTEADVIVVSLVGERGREVREFIEESLGAEGLRRSVVVATPADTSPLMRVAGCWRASAIAEYFREQGKDVLLLMDSLTRFAQAQREIGLAAGEPPVSRGYTPSVFSMLPNLIERAGNLSGGSITAIYTVLVEGDDLQDPIADAARAILDGHIVLSRSMSESGRLSSH